MHSSFIKNLALFGNDKTGIQLIEKHLAIYVYKELLASNTSEEHSIVFACICLLLLKHLHQGHSAISLDTLCIELNSLSSTLKQNTRKSAFDTKNIIDIIDNIDWCLNISLDELIKHSQLATTPVIFFKQSKLFCLQKQFMEEMRIAKAIMTRITSTTHKKIKAHNNQYLDTSQLHALKGALNSNFSLIYGGPGSGKTSTIFHLIYALLKENKHTRIALSALTGKAASRIKQSIQAQSQSLSMELNLHNLSASTLHRLLGGHSHDEFTYHANNPLALDVLIIDEVSMLNFSLFKATLDALPSHCRLILLGDPQQLPSIDSGNILQSLIKAGSTHQSLNAHLHPLSGQHRFDATSSLARCLQHMQQRNYPDLEKCLQDAYTANSDHSLMINDWHTHSQTTFIQDSEQQVGAFLAITKNPSISINDKINAFYEWQILTPFKDSEWGSHAINSKMDQYALNANNNLTVHHVNHQTLYHGKPILITQNNYQTGLFNGDIGLCLEDEEQQLYAYFKDEKNLKILPISQLPEFEGCYAISIHKAQGSEFKHAYLVLPEAVSQKQQQIFNQSLIYTAISRAQEHATIYSKIDTLMHCCTRTEDKNTLLGDILADLAEESV